MKKKIGDYLALSLFTLFAISLLKYLQIMKYLII